MSAGNLRILRASGPIVETVEAIAPARLPELETRMKIKGKSARIASAGSVVAMLLVGSITGTASGEDRTGRETRSGSIAYAAPDPALDDNGAWVAKADGSHARSLNLPTFSYRLAWSPDGQWLVVQAWQGSVMRPVIVRPDGRDARVLSPPGLSEQADVSPCVWTPTGAQLVCQVINFHGDPSQDGLWLMDARDGRHSRRLTTNPFPPAEDFGGGDLPGGVSPDGRWVVFTRAKQDLTNAEGQTGALMLVRTDGGVLRQLTSHGTANSHDDALSGWSPDGRTIIFGGADGSINTIRPDGSHLTKVPIRGIKGGAYVRSPSWSPDGKRILARIFLESTGTWGLYTLTPHGRELTRLQAPETAEVPVWGPRPNGGATASGVREAVVRAAGR